MGFAFLPIGIGSLIGGWFGGTLTHHFGEVTHQPGTHVVGVTAVGMATAVLLWIYDRTLKPASVCEPQRTTRRCQIGDHEPRRARRYRDETLENKAFEILRVLCLSSVCFTTLTTTCHSAGFAQIASVV